MGIDRRQFLAAGGALVASSLLRPARGWADDASRFVETLPATLERNQVPGISIAHGAAGGDPSHLVAGVTEAGGKIAVTPQTVFACGSLSKPVLATVALRLHMAGKFDLDRPLAEMLDGDLPTGPGAESLSARHGLEHTAGLRNWRFTLKDPFATSRRPGTAWGYSGEGVMLVQRALEKVTGHGLEALARKHVFEPFGMKSSSFLWSEELEGRSAIPSAPPGDRFAEYAVLFRFKDRALVEWARSKDRDPAEITLDEARAGDAEVSALAAKLAGRELPETDPMPNFLGPNGAGGLRSTAGDYLRFLHGWLKDAKLLEVAFAKPVPRPGNLRWGLGWGLEGEGDPGPFWHWGEGLGYRALAYAAPDADRGFVALTNGNEGMTVIEEAFVAATGKRSPIFDAI